MRKLCAKSPDARKSLWGKPLTQRGHHAAPFNSPLPAPKRFPRKYATKYAAPPSLLDLNSVSQRNCAE